MGYDGREGGTRGGGVVCERCSQEELCAWEGVSVLWRGCSVIEAGRGVGRACVVKEGRKECGREKRSEVVWRGGGGGRVWDVLVQYGCLYDKTAARCVF